MARSRRDASNSTRQQSCQPQEASNCLKAGNISKEVAAGTSETLGMPTARDFRQLFVYIFFFLSLSEDVNGNWKKNKFKKRNNFFSKYLIFSNLAHIYKNLSTHTKSTRKKVTVCVSCDKVAATTDKLSNSSRHKNLDFTISAIQ
jgi:hypothetical protein